MIERIIIGADHAGFFLKEKVKTYAQKKGLTVVDVGTNSDASVDYPDYGESVARMVAEGENTGGVLICASGVGMTIVANKFPRIRAVLALDEDTARQSRLHNDTNVLVLAAKRTGEEDAIKILEVWLATPFAGGRHERRVEKIKAIEDSLGARITNIVEEQ